MNCLDYEKGYLMKKGQHIKIINTGYMYTSYDTMAKLLGISDYIRNVRNSIDNDIMDEKGIIVDFKSHTHTNVHVIVVAIYLPKLKQHIMIGTKGLIILPDPVILPDELFEL